MSAELRVATPEDAEPLTELVNAIGMEQYGEPEVTVEELRPVLSSRSSRSSSRSATAYRRLRRSPA